MRLALGVEYDGSAFSGYQIQNNAPSIQEALQDAISQIAAEPVVIDAAGRTDAGVHATQQVIAFSTHAQRPMRAWVQGTNGLTPKGVKVRWAESVPEDFHPRFQATARRYMYLFYEAAGPLPLLDTHATQTRVLADEDMHRAAQALIGEHDFTAFRAARCQSASPFRCMHKISVQRSGPIVVVDITANAFLLHMVRNIAGSLWQIGERRRGPDWMGELLAGRDRNAAAPTAPARGLYLVDVRFPNQDFPPGELPGILRALGDLSRF